MQTILNIAGLVNDSIVDGPGIRFTIFAQGCSHDCPGCHNPATHPFGIGTDMSVAVHFKLSFARIFRLIFINNTYGWIFHWILFCGGI